jgi:DNA-binding transcriptional LysR family regulator
MRSSLDDLHAFAAVFQAGGFTAAGRRLRLTTNAVSLRVQNLERDLGVQLFVRTTRSVAPTEEGRAFFARVSQILLDLEAAEDELRTVTDQLSGTVRLAIPGSLATEPLFARLRTFLGEHPRVSVQIRVSNLPIDLVSEGVDIGVEVGRTPSESGSTRLLGRVTWVLVATRSYLDAHGRPQRPEELARHQCLRLFATQAQQEWTLVDNRGKEVTVSVGGGVECDDSRALGEAAYCGLGIGVRPAGECARAEADGRLERVLPGYQFRPFDVCAVMPQGRLRVARVAAMLDVLRAAVRELE